MKPPCIELDRVSKRFGGVTALDQVSLQVHHGEVHAVVGENGAGKSTLMKLLAGVFQPDAGAIAIEGRAVRLKNPRDARREGIGVVFQELSLFPHRTVMANVHINREKITRWGLVNRRVMRAATRQVLEQLGTGISPEARVGSLSLGEKQLVEIARTLDQQPRIVILDEPNSALDEAESRRLLDTVRRLRDRGITILYVSHRLEDVFALADRITVLRDGHSQGTRRTVETSVPEVVQAMAGQALHPEGRAEPARASPGAVVLAVQDLEDATARVGPLGFTARAGEILGFAGLEGSGITELFLMLFGVTRRTRGEIRLRGILQRQNCPRAAIEGGWALLPRSRRDQGLMMNGTVGRNVSLVVLDRLLNGLRLVDRRAVRRLAGSWLERLAVTQGTPETRVVNLSGGNQQKVLFAKWLAVGPTLLILDDPTRGVDVGAKAEIHRLCRELARQGMTILMSSSEVEEVMDLADRVLVLAKGALAGEFHRGQVTKAELLRAMVGAPTPQPAGG